MFWMVFLFLGLNFFLSCFELPCRKFSASGADNPSALVKWPWFLFWFSYRKNLILTLHVLTFKDVHDLPCQMAICNGGHHLCLEARITDVMTKCLVHMLFIFKMLSSNFSPQARFPDKVFCTLLFHCLQVNSGIILVQPDSSIS